MDTRIKELIDSTKLKFGLDNYYLARQSLKRNVNIFNETTYTLNMEWFPNHEKQTEDEDSNPEGTAVIDIELNSLMIESVIFVGGKSFANGIKFNKYDREEIIKWIEQEARITYGKQFEFHKEVEDELYFKECIDGVAVSPYGFIEIRSDQEGRLTLFAIHGQFPAKEMIKGDVFSLTLGDVTPIVKEQLKLIEVPSHEHQRFIPVYGIEEIYITNDNQASTIPFEFIVNARSYLKVNESLYWDNPLDKPFDGLKINWTEEVTAAQAISNERSPDSFPITEQEQEKCIIAVNDFLRREYADDSGKWKLKTLHRDKGYIHATLRAAHQNNHIFQRKITIIIDAKRFKVLNYIDNKPMLAMFEEFEEAEKVTIVKEDAYEKIQHLLELKPYYVYDFEQKQYVLCGKLDCQYGVDAANGKVVRLGDL
ncbi:hypothetical protein [Oceanobacillus chungangensis]|uniref:DUF4901 domain-containing protein n=1 Tax=Oceanobacillus chungangensis TaxID=1229152 RepID=A0A3D8PP26_9BACI|nr:hypothetical protein [Oceanobacillus chungangensis]RDW17267.1 hypothetical protein CWR45_12805 [Oceanobacillus chungangensis]